MRLRSSDIFRCVQGLLLPACITLLVFCRPATAVVTVENFGPFQISFYNKGDSGSHSGLTGEMNWTAQQRADVRAAIDAWSSRIANTPGRQIQLHVFWNELDDIGRNVLGGSGSVRRADGSTIWNAAEYVWKEEADFTSGYNLDTVIMYDMTAGSVGGGWNFGTGAPAGNAIDFRSVVTHELGHSLGFASSYDPYWNDFGWFNNYGYVGLTAWDKNLVDRTGDAPPANGGPAGSFSAKDNPVYWSGSVANAYYGGQVPIYAPNPFQPGSSLSHLDEVRLGQALMSPSISTGQVVRKPTELEWRMMRDMGWDIASIAGDFDGDGDVDADDIDLFVAGAAIPGALSLGYDLDGDGDVDHDDLDVLIHDLVFTTMGVGSEYGDFNLSGDITTEDMTILAANFGRTSVGWAQGDANGDRTVDTLDLTILGTYFGFTAAQSTVPEPAAVSLLAAGGLLALLRRR